MKKLLLLPFLLLFSCDKENDDSNYYILKKQRLKKVIFEDGIIDEEHKRIEHDNGTTYNLTYVLFYYYEDSYVLGKTTVKQPNTFSLYLPDYIRKAKLKNITTVFPNCEYSNPYARIATLALFFNENEEYYFANKTDFSQPFIYSDDVPATVSLSNSITYYYSNEDVIIKCSDNQNSPKVIYDVKLKKGWNKVYTEHNDNLHKCYTKNENTDEDESESVWIIR